jgi:hypothetical protein
VPDEGPSPAEYFIMLKHGTHENIRCRHLFAELHCRHQLNIVMDKGISNPELSPVFRAIIGVLVSGLSPTSRSLKIGLQLVHRGDFTSKTN